MQNSFAIQSLYTAISKRTFISVRTQQTPHLPHFPEEVVPVPRAQRKPSLPHSVPPKPCRSSKPFRQCCAATSSKRDHRTALLPIQSPSQESGVINAATVVCSLSPPLCVVVGAAEVPSVPSLTTPPISSVCLGNPGACQGPVTRKKKTAENCLQAVREAS